MRLSLAFALAFVPLAASAANDMVHLKKSDGRVEITIGDKPFATYHFEGFKKPFMIDLRAPNGTIVTRSLEKEAVTDHPHHKGLWLSVDEVNESRHWMEAQLIETKSVEILKAEGDPAKFRVENVWLNDDKKPLLKETTTISVSADRLVSYDVTLTPAEGEAMEIGDTKEGMFAIRLRDDLREKGGSGKIVNANGAKGEKEAWGQTAPWVDYSGTVDGKTVGVALFDHPGNIRPSRYHVRAYGLFAVNPFGERDYTNGKNEAKPVHLKLGETLRLRYAAFIHDGDTNSADVAGRYREFVKSQPN